MATTRYKSKQPPEGKKDQGKDSCIVWTGWFHKKPILKFHAGAIVSREPSLREVGQRYNMSYKMGRNGIHLLRNLFFAHGFKQVSARSKEFNLMWAGGQLEDSIFEKLLSFQKINHFPKSMELGRKDSLCKSIKRVQEDHDVNLNILPETYVLPEDYQDVCQAFDKNKGPWIVKPVSSSCGHGIYLIDSPSQVNLGENIVVSRYITNPLLINGYKFDFRLYVLVTSFDPLIIYLYEEGLTRFATVKYELSGKSMENRFVHLTNTSVNQKNKNYVLNDEPEVEDVGNKWSMSATLRYLKQCGKDTTALMEQVEDLIIKTIISAEGPIVEACRSILPHRGNCFELFGFDVLIDENLKPWLIEVNRSPALGCESPLDQKIKANLMADTFTIVGIECQDPRQENKGSSTTSKQIQGGKKKLTSQQSIEMDTAYALQQLKEESKRRGGFVRLFPRYDTQQRYGFLLENKTLNFMLASHLHVERPPLNETSQSRPVQNAARYERQLAPLQHKDVACSSASTSTTCNQSSQEAGKDLLDCKTAVKSSPMDQKPSRDPAGGMNEPVNFSAMTTSMCALTQRLLNRCSQLPGLGLSSLRRQFTRRVEPFNPTKHNVKACFQAGPMFQNTIVGIQCQNPRQKNKGNSTTSKKQIQEKTDLRGIH